jgi:hypothetical protein
MHNGIPRRLPKFYRPYLFDQLSDIEKEEMAEQALRRFEEVEKQELARLKKGLDIVIPKENYTTGIFMPVNKFLLKQVS